ncbi:hypothetical protein T4A_915 [Trichinella pseudospiralis]|uniref:Uncharacterized protein n=1 Tax=Trichinella pseudospiralis TaxID=6337 RepID=A0A0V1DP49_TRIPS|nr:hypothetical protein T4A_915 [Trichinella pseudospiralis]
MHLSKYNMYAALPSQAGDRHYYVANTHSDKANADEPS